MRMTRKQKPYRNFQEAFVLELPTGHYEVVNRKTGSSQIYLSKDFALVAAKWISDRVKIYRRRKHWTKQ